MGMGVYGRYRGAICPRTEGPKHIISTGIATGCDTCTKYRPCLVGSQQQTAETTQRATTSIFQSIKSVFSSIGRSISDRVTSIKEARLEKKADATERKVIKLISSKKDNPAPQSYGAAYRAFMGAALRAANGKDTKTSTAPIVDQNGNRATQCTIDSISYTDAEKKEIVLEELRTNKQNKTPGEYLKLLRWIKVELENEILDHRAAIVTQPATKAVMEGQIRGKQKLVRIVESEIKTLPTRLRK